ncbi:hypothetical protein J7I98_08305 [Streptomyces sp. ISL-98]|uniref:hypothetical protein n=1 Tax=Streptomyces sp. ISL-98 TaxID=2819192 RepID=UPI001BEBBF2D|nr:hypothetical protein [Streptomyces sp. ISL-98]MBT2505901.1 hypothetical protein [Streptomyces sp. ISL-98]
MRTTSTRTGQRPEAETDKERAWGHLLEAPGGIRRIPAQGPPRARRLAEIARSYDRICQRAQGLLDPDATETDILAALLVIRTLREKLESDELTLITLARTKRITWARIATALEVKSRQSAERRHLQLSRAHPRPDGTLPRTQSERVEDARERRSRRAERDWAMRHARTIRATAARLAALPDLQQRADQSREAQIMAAISDPDAAASGARNGMEPTVQSMAWPTALKGCLAEDARFRAAPEKYVTDEQRDLGDEKWQLQQAEAATVHRMLGLISYAGDQRNIDLSDEPELVSAIARLTAASQQQSRR